MISVKEEHGLVRWRGFQLKKSIVGWILRPKTVKEDFGKKYFIRNLPKHVHCTLRYRTDEIFRKFMKSEMLISVLLSCFSMLTISTTFHNAFKTFRAFFYIKKHTHDHSK